MKDITPILQALGLQDSEIKTYLKGLEAGPSTAAELSKLTDYSRQGTYTAIEALSKRGLIATVMRGKKRLYVAEPPSKLLVYAKRRDQEMHERVKDLERLAPELELQTGGERPVVRMFEGKAGLQAIIEDIRETRPKHIVEITDVDAMYSILDLEDLMPMRKVLKRLKSDIKGIYSGITKGEGTVDADRLSLPKNKSGFRSGITVYENKIALTTFEGKMHSVIIESHALAEAMKIVFEYSREGLISKQK